MFFLKCYALCFSFPILYEVEGFKKSPDGETFFVSPNTCVEAYEIVFSHELIRAQSKSDVIIFWEITHDPQKIEHVIERYTFLMIQTSLWMNLQINVSKAAYHFFIIFFSRCSNGTH